MEISLHCCQAGEDQALDEHGQLLLMFHSAVDDAVLIKLTLDADLLIQSERHDSGEVQSLFRDVHDLTEGRRLIQDYEAAPGHRHAKLMTLVVHRMGGPSLTVSRDSLMV